MDIRPPGKRLVRTQSMLFTIMGDYLWYRNGGEFSVRIIIEMMAKLGYSEASIRSALSRLCGTGWLINERRGRKSFYRLSKNSKLLLQQGYNRIYYLQQRQQEWNGQWQIITYSIPEEQRNLRERLRKELNWVGFGSLSPGCWISPYEKKEEVDRIIEILNISRYVHMFIAQFQGYVSQKELVSRCWDLERINASYEEFLEKYQPRYAMIAQRLETDGKLDRVSYFIERVNLIHEYRRFPFLDPGLPLELLPDNWLGFKSADLLKQYHDLLAEGANSLVDALFAKEFEDAEAGQ